MTSNAIMFVFGITQEFGIDVFRIVAALWFFSVGYLLLKKASRFLSEQRSRAALNADPHEISSLAAGNYPSPVM